MGLFQGLPHPHVDQFGSTAALALSGAALRAHAGIAGGSMGG
jgi:hypothetical protein